MHQNVLSRRRQQGLVQMFVRVEMIYSAVSRLVFLFLFVSTCCMMQAACNLNIRILYLHKLHRHLRAVASAGP